MTDVELRQFIGWANDTLGHCMGLQPRHVHVELSKPEYCRGVIGAYWSAWSARRDRAVLNSHGSITDAPPQRRTGQHSRSGLGCESPYLAGH